MDPTERDTLHTAEQTLSVIARQFIEETAAHPSVEVFYRWLKFPEHATLYARWFEAAQRIPAFRDGDMEHWKFIQMDVFSHAVEEWEGRLTR